MATVTAQLPDNPFFLEALSGDTPVSYDAEDFRRVLGGIWPRTGICTPTSFQITQAGVVGWSVQVAAGYCVVGNTLTETARYLVHNPTSQTVPLTGFNTNPSGTRTHKVWLGIYDKLLSGTEYAAKIIITEDTGAGAAAPSIPAYYLQLGSFTISAGQSNVQNAHITNTVRHASMGPSPVALDITANIADASSALSVATAGVVYRNGVCTLQGGFVRTSGNPFDAGGQYNLATLPSAYKPATTKYLVAAGSTNQTGTVGTGLGSVNFYRVTVFTSGVIQADLPYNYAPNTLFIDGLSFEID